MDEIERLLGRKIDPATKWQITHPSELSVEMVNDIKTLNSHSEAWSSRYVRFLIRDFGLEYSVELIRGIERMEKPEEIFDWEKKTY